MAIDYLRLIEVFARSTGSRQLYRAPAATCQIESVPLGEGGQQAHFVYDLSLSKRVLGASDQFVQDHFLDKLLADCDPTRVKWIRLFVEQSPEFLDGPAHSRLRLVFKASFDRFEAAISRLTAEEVADLMARELETPGATALTIAKSLVHLCIQRILQPELKRNVVVKDDDLLFGPDLFTPSVRIKSIIYRLNEITDQFVQEYVSPEKQKDTDYMLPLLSLFFMASRPVLTGCVAVLNQAHEAEGLLGGDEFVNFHMVPTNFVAREAVRDVDLLGTPVRKGDKLYVMLFESTGCPFNAQQTIPFGYGKHLCPGANLSRLIVQRCLAAAERIPADQWRSLIPSTIQQRRGGTFLSFEDRR